MVKQPKMHRTPAELKRIEYIQKMRKYEKQYKDCIEVCGLVAIGNICVSLCMYTLYFLGLPFNINHIHGFFVGVTFLITLNYAAARVCKYISKIYWMKAYDIFYNETI